MTSQSRPDTSTSPQITIPAIAEDGSLYPIEKMKAHREGIHHVALSVFVFCGEELLIQRRAKEKYHCGGQWANTCCTHPHFGEEIKNAVPRRLQEELGFSIPAVKKRVEEYSADVGGGLWERERVHMFRADIEKSDIQIVPNPKEVSEVKWLTSAELRAEMLANPDHYTPWFRIYMERFPDLRF